MLVGYTKKITFAFSNFKMDNAKCNFVLYYLWLVHRYYSGSPGRDMKRVGRRTRRSNRVWGRKKERVGRGSDEQI
jgi:hypothetical protein